MILTTSFSRSVTEDLLPTMTTVTNINISETLVAQRCEPIWNVQHMVRFCLFAFGAISNIGLFPAVAANKKLRSVTFTIIGALSLTDIIYHVSAVVYIWTVVIFIDDKTFSYPNNCYAPLSIEQGEQILGSIISIAYQSSSMHVPFLAIIRYFVIVYPIKSRVYLTNKIIIWISIVIWIVSCSMYLPVAVAKWHQDILEIVIWFMSYLIPLIITSFAHALKIFSMKRNNLVIRRKEVDMMSIMVTIILITFAILPLPFHILKFIHFFGKDVQISFNIWFICGVFAILQNCSNPIIYGFMSNRCRETVVVLCCKTEDTKRQDAYTVQNSRP